MKKIILLLLCALPIAQAAWGQNTLVPGYSEVYEENSGKLRSKEWQSTRNVRMEMPGEDGKTTTVIFRADSLKFYILDTEKKTWLSIDPAQITGGAIYGIAALEHEGNSVKRTFINEENVGGYSCRHYRVESALAHKGGTTSYSDWDEWVYEPYKLVIRRSDDIRPGQYTIRQNIAMGPQPESLFEIPKDYKGSAMPLGGMMEMITGQSKEQNQQGIENIMDGFKKLEEDMKSATEGKSQEEQIQNLLKMIEGQQKKK